MDSGDSEACGACDSVRGEPQPRRARIPRSHKYLEKRSAPRPLLRRRCHLSARSHWGRRGEVGLRDGRRLEDCSVQPSSVQRSSIQPSSIRLWSIRLSSVPSSSFQSTSFQSTPVRLQSDVVNQFRHNQVTNNPAGGAGLGATGGDVKMAQLCLARRSRAKVSWFPLADWLAERAHLQITR